MRFLTLATLLLPVLDLGGLVSAEDVLNVDIHRSHNDSVYESSEESSNNAHPSHKDLTVEPFELTTVTSIPYTIGQRTLSASLDENSTDLIPINIRVATTNQPDGLRDATKSQFNDDTADNIVSEITKPVASNGETTELSSVIGWILLNTTENERKRLESETMRAAHDSILLGERTSVSDDDVSQLSPIPHSEDTRKPKSTKMDPNLQRTEGSVTTNFVPNLDATTESNSVINTDDTSTYRKSIHQRARETNATVMPIDVGTRKSNDKNINLKTSIQNSEEDATPVDEINITIPPDTTTEKSVALREESWLSILQSLVPNEKERLDFNDKILQSIQNTVSNSNVNHNVLNAPSVPCSHSIQPPSSDIDPPRYGLPSPSSRATLPHDIPVEPDGYQEYRNFEMEPPRPPYITYTDTESENSRSPYNSYNPDIAWDVPLTEAVIDPNNIGGEIIMSQPQSTKLVRRCHRIRVKSKKICRKEKPVCVKMWKGCRPICKSGKTICKDHPSQKLIRRLICENIWTPILRPMMMYPVEVYDYPDYETFDHQTGLLQELKQDPSLSKAAEYEHEILELHNFSDLSPLEEIPELEEDVTVPESDEDFVFSEKAFEEAFREAINRAPEILELQPSVDLESETVRNPELVHFAPTTDPLSNISEDQNKRETTSANVNHNVNTNVNSNMNVNLNSNNPTWQPVLPNIQPPVIPSIIGKVVGESNAGLNRNSNVDTNVNVNHNLNANDNHKSPMPQIVHHERDGINKTLEIGPTMPILVGNGPSNTKINQNHEINSQDGVPKPPELDSPPLKHFPKIERPAVSQPMLEPIPIQNINSNANMNHNNNINRNIQIPTTMDVHIPEVTSPNKNPIVLSNVLMPPINEGNYYNADANVNPNMGVDVNRNKNDDQLPETSKVAVEIPIAESFQVGDTPLEILTPKYNGPMLPASLSSSDIKSNVHQDRDGNVNLNSIDDTNVSTANQAFLSPSGQHYTSVPMLIKAAPEVIPPPEVLISTGTGVNANQNLNSNVNMDNNQNINRGTIGRVTPVTPELVETPTTLNRLIEEGQLSNNVDINGNAMANLYGVPNSSLPMIISEPRPVANALPKIGPSAEVSPVATLPSGITDNHNVNSNANFNYNSNINNNVNYEIAVTSEEPVSPVIKPVEYQPVAEQKLPEINLLTPAQIDVSQNLQNRSANINGNVNLNPNVNINDNVDSNTKYKANDEQTAQQLSEIAREPDPVIPTVNQILTHSPEFEVNDNVATLGVNVNSASNMNQNMNVNFNHNSNVNTDYNSDLNPNNNIGRQNLGSLPTPALAPVYLHEPKFLAPETQPPIFSQALINKGPEVPPLAEVNSNYNANVNINRNHNSNVNTNFNQNGQIRPSSLLPQMAPLPWIQEPSLKSRNIPSLGLSSIIPNFGVSLNQNLNANLNHNVNLNSNHNIVPREPSEFSNPQQEIVGMVRNYAPVLEPDVREPVMIAAPTPVLEDKKSSIPQVTRNSQVSANVNANANANVNMNYNSNYNHNANYNDKGVANENETGRVPLMKEPQNVLPSPLIASAAQSPNRGRTGLWDLQKNSNGDANYNSNINYNTNVNANSNYNSNLGQGALGIIAPPNGLAPQPNQGIQGSLFSGNPAISAPMIPNTLIGKTGNPTQLEYNGQQNINTNANYNSNLNYNSNYNGNSNHNADYNTLQMTERQKQPRKKGWYELWYNNGEDKDGWTEIWNNKQFKKFLEQQLKDIKQQEDIDAQSHAFAVAR